jgi:predicted outer membrane repeat protein
MRTRGLFAVLSTIVFLTGFIFSPAAALAGPAAPMPGTLQDLINAAPDGGAVTVPAGVHQESLTIAKNLTLSGEDRSTVILVAPEGQRVITISGAVTVHLRHLTIEGGNPIDDAGGGIKVQDSNLTIEDCLVRDNRGVYGGGLFQNGAAGMITVTESRFERNATANHGGGLCIWTGTLSLNKTEIVDNTASGHGGGISVWSGSTSVIGGRFEGNRAGLNGGGVNVNNGITASETTFVDNAAGADGGALLQYNPDQTVNLTGVSVENNRSAHQGGGVWVKGNTAIQASSFISNGIVSTSTALDIDGAALYATLGTLHVSGSTFDRNRIIAPSSGFNSGGGIKIDGSSSALVESSSFSTNTAWSGAGISSDATVLTVTDSRFRKNSGGYGAGIDASTLAVSLSSFEGNAVVNEGGAVSVGMDLQVDRSRFTGNTAGYSGGAIRASGHAAITNSLLADNQAGSGGGAATRLENAVAREFNFVTVAYSKTTTSPAILLTDGSLHLADSIIANHAVGIKVTGGALQQDHDLYGGNGTNVLNTGGTVSDGAGMLYDLNPSFADLAAGNYHLRADSPAVDHGVDAGVIEDLDGDPRPMGHGYDIGMDEAWVRAYLPLAVR